MEQNGEVIENLKTFNYLGIIFSKGGSFVHTKKNNVKTRSIWYSGGLGIFFRAKNFFSDNFGARLCFSPALRAGLFFYNQKLLYTCIGFRDNFMLNSGFCDNYMLNSGFRDNFMLNWCFRNKFKFNPGLRDNFTLQQEQPESFIKSTQHSV